MTFEPSCLHESWDCAWTGQSGPWYHHCNDCDFNWSNLSRFFADSQVGLCDVCQNPNGTGYTTKDSGKREEYDSGMRRDTQEGKPRFDLMLVDGVGYQDQFLYRFAALLERGAAKYGERNWQLADSDAELARFRASALRHMFQWACGEQDEDHAAAVAFNLMAYETIKAKIQ